MVCGSILTVKAYAICDKNYLPVFRNCWQCKQRIFAKPDLTGRLVRLVLDTCIGATTTTLKLASLGATTCYRHRQAQD